jgi:hypothetical protein
MISGDRWSRRSAVVAFRRTALCAAYLIGCVLAVRAEGATGAASSAALRDEDVRRAEKVLLKLRLLDEAAAANDASAYRALASKLYPGLFITVADMRPSDLHTDLSTAVFLDEEVARTWFDAEAATADCARERQDTYLPLCLDLRGGTVRQLLLAKARLHARWAEAVVKDYRREGDAATSRALSEMRAARDNDLVIAARVMETLKPLEGLFNTLPIYADHQERLNVSNASFDRLDGEYADALNVAGVLLAQMPRSLTFYHLSDARRAYMDGLFWYRKVHQSKKLVVNVKGFASDPLQDLKLNTDQVGGTVIANWKSAVKYTRLAERSLSGMERR